jgi:hypothetical protein
MAASLHRREPREIRAGDGFSCVALRSARPHCAATVSRIRRLTSRDGLVVLAVVILP